jgi:hypothetical protein
MVIVSTHCFCTCRTFSEPPHYTKVRLKTLQVHFHLPQHLAKS